MNREKQIEEIAKILLIDCEGACTDCEYYGRYGGSLCIPMRLANELYNAGYRKQEWISVDEKLPERQGYYLGRTYKGLMMIAPFFPVYADDKPEFKYDIAYWMPLPEAPKMKGGK